MTYALSFAEDFFVPANDGAMESTDRPTSVLQAILSLDESTRRRIATALFGADCVDPMVVLERVRETNTCENLDSPVRVWIDSEGQFTVIVFDDPGTS